MKNQFVAFALAASLLVATAMPALAQQGGQNSTGTLELEGATMVTIAPTAITMDATTLDGVEQTIDGSTIVAARPGLPRSV